MSFGSSGLPNIEQDMEPFQLPVSRPSEADIHDSPRNLRRRIARESSSDITDPPAIQLAKAKASYRPDGKMKTKKEKMLNYPLSLVSESDILRDLIFIFQGIDGQYIKLNPTTDEYLIDKQLLCVSEPTEQLIYRLTETGWLYTHIKSFIEENMNLNRSGLVGQSLCAAIQDELTDYYKLIAILEAQVEKQLAQKSRVISDQSLTLKRLLVWMEDANNKLRLMSMLVDASQGTKEETKTEKDWMRSS